MHLLLSCYFRYLDVWGRTDGDLGGKYWWSIINSPRGDFIKVSVGTANNSMASHCVEEVISWVFCTLDEMFGMWWKLADEIARFDIISA